MTSRCSYRLRNSFYLPLLAAFLVSGCAFAPEPPDRWPAIEPARPAHPVSRPAPSMPPAVRPELTAPATLPKAQPLARLGYTIQVGAFAQLDNAVRLERLLQSLGIDAYYFRHESGLYKVRFGNYASKEAARRHALQLQQQRLIEKYYLVPPEISAAVKLQQNLTGLRAELVDTAMSFIGVPYRWGGTDDAEGFDCSGLTMVSYRLNGLDLPRSSMQQFDSGQPLESSQLQPGDLVFFATRGGERVSHVGMYIGAGQFVHAPRSGQKVRTAFLTDPFYQRTYLGARSYF